MRPNDVVPTILAVVMILCALMIVMAALFMRHRKTELSHKERLLAMEKGISLPPEPAHKQPAPWSPRVYLLRGLLWLCTGISLTVMCLGISVTSRRPLSIQTRLSTAQYLKGRGASDDQIRQYLRDAGNENEGLPFGFAFVGMVPAAVGLAYLVFYRNEGLASAREPQV